MKKIISILLAVILVAALQAPALAADDQTPAWQSSEYSFTAPEGMYALSANTLPDDPAWALLGVADVTEKLKEYNDMGVVVNFVSEDGKTNINVMRKESDYSKTVYNLQAITDEEREKVLTDLIQTQSDDFSVTREWFPAGDNLFYRFQIDTDQAEMEIHELIIGTIVNGYALNFDIVTTDEAGFTDQQVETLETLAASLKFTEVREKPEPDAVSTVATILLLVLLVAAVALPLIYLPIKSRREKKQKQKLAEQLSEYHKTHSADTVEGEAMFINSTDCTKEAIHKFAIYQAYIKNIRELIFGAFMCVAMLIAAFVTDTEWWMKLAAVGIGGYYIYKIISASSTLEKVQRKVFGRGPSQTAHYSFYPNAFRVSGIQAASVVPYFQITDVRRQGQYLYLYYGPENAYMIDQYGFVMGDFESFAKFIAEKTKKEKGN